MNWEEIRDTDKKFHITLEQNAKMLIKSKEGVTVRGPFSNVLQRDASNEHLHHTGFGK